MGISDLPDVFKGEQLKRDYIVSEHAGRGSSDLLLNNLYFTLTKRGKVFMILEDKNFLHQLILTLIMILMRLEI